MITVDQDLAKWSPRLYYIAWDGVEVRPSGPRLREAIQGIIEDFRRRYGTPERLLEDPRVKALRSFLWRMGIDPTKVRPSSEALARRVLRGRGLPWINNVVDSGNAASLESLVPIGLYDLDRLSPPLRLARCLEECLFQPIGGGEKRLKPGTPVLLDSNGLVVHVFPHRDSRVSMITESTRRVLGVSVGVEPMDWGLLSRALNRVEELLRIDGLDPSRLEEGRSRIEP